MWACDSDGGRPYVKLCYRRIKGIKVSDMLSLDGVYSNLPATNHTSIIHKTNAAASVFAQDRGSISRYHGLSKKDSAEISRGSMWKEEHLLT